MSTDGEHSRTYTRTNPSCAQCQRLKKRCDRTKPRCSLCLRCGLPRIPHLGAWGSWANPTSLRHNRICSYTLTNSSVGSTASLTDVSSNSSPPSSNAINHDFSAVFFLDSVLFRRSLSRLPDADFILDPVVLAFVGDVLTKQAIVSKYFSMVHPWIPFLSKRHFMERVFNPLGPAWSGNTLLIAVMKLVASSPTDCNPRSGIYISIKTSLLRAVESSLFEFRIFQTMLLLALYELGHGIHPEAYMTIGSCIRFGNALGLNMTVEPTVQVEINGSESEERRRSWWAILLLER
jgi:hypothetical protein